MPPPRNHDHRIHLLPGTTSKFPSLHPYSWSRRRMARGAAALIIGLLTPSPSKIDSPCPQSMSC
ncbi:hypothetical protein A2U01_0050716 [Trifolium medium]|uniref:Uncharacterized protein n=1 Tax=Trifolium medium TaxID=97028 RepID=A0A392QZS2_9FABA|nr:hypothetical protein [Trifolium medium]